MAGSRIQIRLITPIHEWRSPARTRPAKTPWSNDRPTTPTRTSEVGHSASMAACIRSRGSANGDTTGWRREIVAAGAVAIKCAMPTCAMDHSSFARPCASRGSQTARYWCRRRDSNPHALRPPGLSRLRLPFRHSGIVVPSASLAQGYSATRVSVAARRGATRPDDGCDGEATNHRRMERTTLTRKAPLGHFVRRWCGGDDGNRTRVRGFAVLTIASAGVRRGLPRARVWLIGVVRSPWAFAPVATGFATRIGRRHSAPCLDGLLRNLSRSQELTADFGQAIPGNTGMVFGPLAISAAVLVGRDRKGRQWLSYTKRSAYRKIIEVSGFQPRRRRCPAYPAAARGCW